MSFMLVFLSTPYMKNPYLKGQFVEVRKQPACSPDRSAASADCGATRRSCTTCRGRLTRPRVAASATCSTSTRSRSRTSCPVSCTPTSVRRSALLLVEDDQLTDVVRVDSAEIEVTGSHTQFYDKFNIRYYITQLFKLVWSNPTHRESLKRESQCVDVVLPTRSADEAPL